MNPPETEPLFHHTSVIAILGMRGVGKTTMSGYLQSLYPRQLIIDYLFEHEDGLVVHTFEELCAALLTHQNDAEFRIIFHWDHDYPDQGLLFEETLKVARAAGRLLIAVEEIQEFIRPGFLPPAVRQLALLGRHDPSAFIFTSQRPAEVHKTLLSQAHVKIIGTMAEPNDIFYLGKFVGRDHAEALADLPPRVFTLFPLRGAPVKITLSGETLKKLS